VDDPVGKKRLADKPYNAHETAAAPKSTAPPAKRIISDMQGNPTFKVFTNVTFDSMTRGNEMELSQTITAEDVVVGVTIHIKALSEDIFGGCL
jgi:hypothetical protein